MGKRGLACGRAFPQVCSLVGQEIFRVSFCPGGHTVEDTGGRGRTVWENVAWLVDDHAEPFRKFVVL